MAISSKEGHEHEFKWGAIHRRLEYLGYWVKWQRDLRTDEYKYAVGKVGEKQPMGVYDNEETALAMVKMILTNAKHEEN